MKEIDINKDLNTILEKKIVTSIWNDTIYIIDSINETYYEIMDLINVFNNTIVPAINTTIYYANYTLYSVNNIIPVAVNTILYINHTIEQINLIINITKPKLNNILFILIYIIFPLLIMLFLLTNTIGIIFIIKLLKKTE